MGLSIVPVNFFQKSYDSRWRKFLFSWRQGNYLKFLRNRIQWYLYPSMRRVSAFPLHLDIEITAGCNLRCPMCPSRLIGRDAFKNYGRMDLDLFKKIVDEGAEHGLYSIRLSWRGEVFTHPQFLEFVRYAKVVKKIPQVSFLTNGFLLKGDHARKLIEYGVDYISISVDGTGPIYEKIRFPFKFDEIYANLAEFKKLKQQLRSRKPLVRITSLWPAIAGDPQGFLHKMQRVSDQVNYNPLKDYTITTQDRENFKICQFLYERLFIGFDGAAHPCSNTINPFVIGSARETSIAEIWHGEALSRVRKMHEAGQRLDVFPCRVCSYGVDFQKRWKGKDWSDWDPGKPASGELPPASEEGSSL